MRSVSNDMHNITLNCKSVFKYITLLVNKYSPILLKPIGCQVSHTVEHSGMYLSGSGKRVITRHPPLSLGNNREVSLLVLVSCVNTAISVNTLVRGSIQESLSVCNGSHCLISW